MTDPQRAPLDLSAIKARREDAIVDGIIAHEQLIVEDIDALIAEVERLRKVEQRWQWARAGLFVTTGNGKFEPEIVYASGMMDEVTQELYDTLPKTKRGMIWDVTPIFDERIRRALTDGEVP